MLPFTIRERVRWSDCDPLGIIFYGAYIRFFEIAEHELLRSLGLPFDILRVERAVWLPRKSITIEFHGPAAMDEEIIVGVGISRIGTTSITFRFEATRASDNAPRATASLTVVSVEKETMTKRELPDWLKAALNSVRVERQGTGEPTSRADP